MEPTTLIIAAIILAAVAFFVIKGKKKHRDPTAGTRPKPNPGTQQPLAPAPFEPPPSPTEDVTPAMFVRRDSDNFIQYAEVLALGPEWADVWWCTNTLPQAGLVDLSDAAALWPLIGNVGCDAHGIIHYGQNFSGRGFEYRDGTGIHMGHLSYRPPMRYEMRKNPSDASPRLQTVEGRQTYGFPALPVEQRYYLDKAVYRARIYREVRNRDGVILDYQPIAPEKHGAWLAARIQERGWSATRPKLGPLGPEWKIG